MNAIFIAPIDIINKTALVDAYAVNTYKYMLNTAKRTSINCFEDIPMPTIWIEIGQLMVIHRIYQLYHLQINHMDIQSLQQQLNSALLRENMIIKMLTNSINGKYIKYIKSKSRFCI